MKENWFFNKRVVFLLNVMLYPFYMHGQQIFYSSFPGDNARTTTFDIIGEYNGMRFIYTKNYADPHITLYNEMMQPVDTIALSFLPYEVKDLRFIALPGRFMLLYQYAEKRNIYCKAVLFDGKGEKEKGPLEIDRTGYRFQAFGEVTYSSVTSEDKSHILIYKMIKRPQDKLLTFETFLLDSNLSLLQKGTVAVPYREETGHPKQVILANNGGCYFIYGRKSYRYQSYYENLAIYYKPAFKNKLLTRTLFYKDYLPSTNILLTLDEEDRKLWLNTFNFDKKNRHLTTFFTVQLDPDSLRVIHKTIHHFSMAVRKALAKKKHWRKSVFDHYEPRKLIFNRQGAALLIAEERFEDADNKVHSGDIGLFSLDKTGDLIKIQRIEKEQDQYANASLGSFLIMNNGRALHFLVNKSHSVSRFLNNRIYLLRDYRYSGRNKVLEQMPVMEKLDKGYQWLPKLGKQVSLNEVIIPCLAGGNLLFGRICY